MPEFTDTIAAVATPSGTSAVALVRVSGSDTARIAGELLGASPPPRRVLHRDYRTCSGEVIDDVLGVFFAGPHSYTGEDSLEISSHGNPFIAQKILEDLFARGCRAAHPGEFTQRAFLNGRMDLSQAEAVMDLIHARSDRALEAANQLLRGSLGRRMNGLIEGLLQALARVEAYIDFPDGDLPPEDRAIVERDLERLTRETENLLATARYGELLRDGVKTVIIGAPNVGKSSLLNRLVGKERALVSPEPGTTRDFIEERVIVGPHCLRLIDTAGLNSSPAPLERLGMEKTLERAAEANLFLVVLSHDTREVVLPDGLSEAMIAGKSIIVLNKSDLALREPATLKFGDVPILRVSALTGAGIDQLRQAITEQIDRFAEPVDGDLVAINARHAHALASAKSALASALENLRTKGPVELLSSDLNAALSSYGDIAGRVDNERMLDALFETFCIGK